MKKFFLLSAVIALLAITTSCSTDYTVEVAYVNYGFPTWYGNLYDMVTVENHIAKLGIPRHDMDNPLKIRGTGSSQSEAVADADRQAKKVADQWVAKIRADGFEGVDLHPTTRFIWNVRGYSVIAEFKWNMD